MPCEMPSAANLPIPRKTGEAAGVGGEEEELEPPLSPDSSLSPSPIPPKPTSGLPPHWTVEDSKRHPGKWYFFNKKTKERRWWKDPPPGVPRPGQNPPQRPGTAVPWAPSSERQANLKDEVQVSWAEAEAEEDEGDEDVEEYDPDADADLVKNLTLGDEDEDDEEDDDTRVDFELPAALQAQGVPHKPFGPLKAGWVVVDSRRYPGKWYYFHQGQGERRWWDKPPGQGSTAEVAAANEEAEREAEARKLRGNDAFKAGDYDGAIEHYTAGIACWPSVVLFQNRAMANLKLETWGSVIADCNSAIAMDVSAPKAYFRRALAWIGLGRLQDAVNDFEEVSRLQP